MMILKKETQCWVADKTSGEPTKNRKGYSVLESTNYLKLLKKHMLEIMNNIYNLPQFNKPNNVVTKTDS